MLILEGTDHHCDDHADDAHERDHCEVLDVVKAPDLCSQQADACDYPNVVIDAAAQRTQGADGIQGQAAESKSTRHEKAEISELDQVAPHLCGPSNHFQAKISKRLAWSWPHFWHWPSEKGLQKFYV